MTKFDVKRGARVKIKLVLLENVDLVEANMGVITDVALPTRSKLGAPIFHVIDHMSFVRLLLWM